MGSYYVKFVYFTVVKNASPVTW